MPRQGSYLEDGYVKQNRELLNDCNSLADSTLTVVKTGTVTETLDTDIFKVGNSSFKAVIAANANVAFNFTQDCTSPAGRYGIWIYVVDHTTLLPTGAITFYVGESTNFANSFLRNYVPHRNGWHYIALDKDSYTSTIGSPSFNNPMVRWKVLIKSNATDEATVYLDSCFRGGYCRPQIMFNFDDGVDNQVAAAATLNALGIYASLNVIESLIDTTNFMTTSELQTLKANGNAICAHGLTNYQILATEAAIRADIVANQSFVANIDSDGSKYLAYPNGEHELSSGDTTILDIVTDLGFKAARTTNQSQNRAPTYGGVVEPLKLDIAGFASGNSLATIKAEVVNAIQSGNSSIFMFHQVTGSTTGTQISVADFTAFANFVKLQKDLGLVDTKTMPEFIDEQSSAKRIG